MRPKVYCVASFFSSAILSSSFMVTKINSTAILATWMQDCSEFFHVYTIYYVGTSSSGKRRRAAEGEMEKTFPGNSSFGKIGGLNPLMNYTFQLSVTYKVSGVLIEGRRTQKILAG